ncbi:fungal protein kinase domain-containing protein [Phanerochaete sordida]|uniref:Fungal protein kinase domain-containing protein n=1 Tax=Phanerochaete sordida TaxID=48140 RepID=A0A9P3GIR3_9APHY|nr:fungal protein kinase domain-containing protein [Phanerochaete sordida]
MDTDGEDPGRSVPRDSGFFDYTPTIDGPESFKTQASATSSSPNALPKSTTSATPDADLTASQNQVLLDLWEQVPEVELGWFQQNLLPKLHKDINIRKTLEKLNNNRSAVENDRWAMFKQYPLRSAADKENIVFSPFPQLVDKICQTAGMSGKRRTVRFECIPNTTPGQTTRPNSSRPDAAAMLEIPQPGSKHKPGDIRWIDVVAPGEFKKSPSEADKNRKQMLWQLAYIMREDPRRRFVHGFTIEDNEMRLWFCSRSNAIVSKPFDFMKDRHSTVLFILSITYGSPTELGFDESIRRLPDGQFDIDVRDNQGGVNTYRTIKVLSNIGADALRGRGTRVWLVNPLTRAGRCDRKRQYVLKDCWIDSDRTNEGDLMNSVLTTAAGHLQEHLNQILLHPITHGRVYAGEVEDHTHNVMFRGAPLPNLLDAIYVRESPLHVKTNVVSSLRVQGAMAPEKAGKKAPPRYSGKIHYRIVYREVGKTLRGVESMSEVFDHLVGVIRGVALLEFCGWIHRDISVGNILVVKEKDQQPDLLYKHIKIADIEYAKRLDDSQQPHGIRTGTIYFMSTEVEAHEYSYRKLIFQAMKPPTSMWFTQITKTPPRPTAVELPGPEIPPFRHNGLHDGESVFWLGLYLLLTSVLARRGKDGKLVADEADAHYQAAQRAFAWKVFAEPGVRARIMTVEGALLADTANLDPRIQKVLTSLDEMRKQILQTYRVVEGKLHEPPHRLVFDDPEFNPQVMFSAMATRFEQIAAYLKDDDILVLTDADAIKEVDDGLKAELWLKKKRTVPGGEGGDDERERKRSRVDSASVPGPSTSGSVASSSGASGSYQSGASAPPDSDASSAEASSSHVDTQVTPKGKGKRRQR